MSNYDQHDQKIYGPQYNAGRDIQIGEQKNSETKEMTGRVKKQKRKNTPITILFIAANPKNTGRLRIDEEIRDIEFALHQTDFRDLFRIEQKWALRVKDLQGYLLRYKPDILHFSGHGSSQSEIMIEDFSGKALPLSTEALNQVFSLLGESIRCVVLNACYSGLQAHAIAQHIDCVVGMSKALGDPAAITFASAFYQALGYGKDIQAAVESGRVQLALEYPNERETPQLLALKGDSVNITFVGNED